jgi:hypothetical protein
MSKRASRATIWYSHGGGRFGNQMLRFAHLIAWIEEHAGRMEVINLAAWPYMNLVNGYTSSPAGLYPPRRSWLNLPAKLIGILPEKLGRGAFTVARQHVLDFAGKRFLGKPIVRVNDGIPGIDLADPAFLARCTDQGGAWLIGWRIASWPLVRKHGDAIRRHLAVRDELAAPGYRLVEEARREADVVIGVLCRQTDYRVFLGGRFFIDQPSMARKLNAVAAMYPGKRVVFVLTSDEPIETSHFSALTHRVATGSQGMGGHFVESIAALSRCDLVVGAPSTFAAWAAFLGAKPYLPLLLNREPDASHILKDALADAAADPECSLSVI